MNLTEELDTKVFGQYMQSLEYIDQIVALINHKYATNCDNEEKAEVLTEVLNDVKLLLMDTPHQEIH